MAEPLPDSPDLESCVWQSVTRADELGDWLEVVSGAPVLREVTARSLRLLGPTSGQHVLEVGCGTGVFLPLLADAVGASGRVVGIDLAPAFVELARQRTEGIGWVRVDEGDAYALPYADRSFDAAHCDRVLMHLDNPSAVIDEMCRVVRPGGRVVVAEPDWASLVIDSLDHVAMDLLIRQANKSRRQPYIGRELNRRLAKAGLIDVCHESVPLLAHKYRDLVSYGLNLPQAADELAATQRLDRSWAQVLIDSLKIASRNGTFCAHAGHFLARGTVRD